MNANLPKSKALEFRFGSVDKQVEGNGVPLQMVIGDKRLLRRGILRSRRSRACDCELRRGRRRSTRKEIPMKERGLELAMAKLEEEIKL